MKDKKERLQIVIIFALALGLRLIYMFFLKKNYFFYAHPSADVTFYQGITVQEGFRFLGGSITSQQAIICVMMERRDYLDRVKNTIFRSPIVALLGSRQCGKTTSARRNEQSNLTKVHHGQFINIFQI